MYDSVDRDELARIVTMIAEEGLPHPRNLDAALDAIIFTCEDAVSYQQDYTYFTPLWGTEKEPVNMRNVLAIKNAEGGGSLLVFGYVKDARGEYQPVGELAKEPPSFFLGR